MDDALLGELDWRCINSFKDPAWLGNLARMNGIARLPLTAPALLLTTVLMLAAPVGHAQQGTTDSFAKTRKLGRGVTIPGYDPIWRSRDQVRFQARIFRFP